MSEMNRSMNHPRCFLPPALCVRFPALKACTEDLPPVLQRPETFRLIMGILQEINQEKMGPVRVLSCVENTSLVSQRPREQQLQTGALREVKQENGDVEDQYQSMYNMDSDLHQEWSLRGVEELFMEPDESQLRCRQANEGAGHFGASVVDEKPSPCLPLVHSYFDQRASNQAAPLLDEKPSLRLQLGKERSRPLPFAEAHIAKERPHALQAIIHADIKSSDSPQLLSKEPLEDRPGLKSKCLDNLQVINRESGRHVGCSESETQTQEKSSLPGAATTSNQAMFSKAVCRKRNTVRIAARWLKDKRAIDAWRSRIRGTDCELKHRRKKTAIGQNSRAVSHKAVFHKAKSWLSRKVRSSMISELKLQTAIRKRPNVHNILRNMNVILALPAVSSEQDTSHLGKEYSEKLPSTSKSDAYERSECSVAFLEKGDYKEDSRQQIEDCNGEAGKRRHWQRQTNACITEVDCCESMLSLALCQPQPSKPCPQSLYGFGLPAEEVVVRTDTVEKDQDDGQCQRTNLNQWYFTQQAKRRSGLHESHKKIMQGTVPAPDQGQLFSSTSRSVVEGNVHLNDGGRSTPYPQSRAQNFEDQGSSVEEGEIKDNTLEEVRQVGPCPRIAAEHLHAEPLPAKPSHAEPLHAEPLHFSPQAEQESGLNESCKKRMRGTLQPEEGNEQHEIKRCHRSDGKRWRCARECLFGAYYCQHHLRARRIGYNRRKSRDVNPVHLKSPTMESVHMEAVLSGPNAV